MRPSDVGPLGNTSRHRLFAGSARCLEPAWTDSVIERPEVVNNCGIDKGSTFHKDPRKGHYAIRVANENGIMDDIRAVDDVRVKCKAQFKR